ncbi:MAG: PorT family protein [Chitinophagales bacterium]|nr:PorT family protein [Chitinophagales bacterium]
MRGYTFLFFLYTSFSLCAQIQHGSDDDKFRLIDAGLILGANFSQVDGDNLDGFNKLGLNTGGIAHINFNPNWSLSFEILFSQKGSRTRPDPDLINTYKLVLNYADVPVAINYKDRNRMIFSAGLAYGRLFSFAEYLNGNETNFPNDPFKNDELSFHVGGTILVGELKHFGVNFRYQQSLTTIGPSINPRVVGLTNKLLSLRGIYYF